MKTETVFFFFQFTGRLITNDLCTPPPAVQHEQQQPVQNPACIESVLVVLRGKPPPGSSSCSRETSEFGGDPELSGRESTMDQCKDKDTKRFLLFKDKNMKTKALSIKKPSIKLSTDPGLESSNQRSTCLTWCWPSRTPRPDRVESECVLEQKPETKSEAKDKTKSAVKTTSPKMKINKMSKEEEECWASICPPGDKDAEAKVWLKESLEKLGDRELKYFHKGLRTMDKSKDGFKPIKQIRLQGADRLDTAELMIQTYPKKIRVVTEKVLEKINTNKGNEVHNRVLDSLDNLNDKQLKYFHWFLQTADESKDGFKPIKKKDLEDADRLDTSDLMVQTYATNTKEVTEKILKKIKNNKGKDIPEAEEQMKPSSPAEAEKALAADGVLKSSEKQQILEKNHTRGNKASCLADTVMDKGTAAWKKMIHHLQAVDAPLSSKLGLSSGPIVQQGSSTNLKVEDSKDDSWQQICPEGDSDADIKQWLKEHLEDLDSREMKYFHWFLQTADKSKDGFKPIKKSRLEHANRLDTVDLMVQTYTNTTKTVAEKIFKKINKNKGDGCKDWLLDILEELDDREMKYLHWYLQAGDKSKDGFKPIKKSHLEGADRLDTVDLMVQTYATKTREVTRKILEKIEKNKETVVPEIEEQSTPSSKAAAEEKVLTRMLNDFVEKVPKETLSQLMEALMTANTLKSSEKETILQNHTRVNMASCFVDIVMEKGTDASKELINRLQTINPHLSSELCSPSTPDNKVKKSLFSGIMLKRLISEEQEKSWQQICPPWDTDAELKHWLKDLLENLRNKEVKYFRWYLRTADESKDGFKPIRRCRLKYADRLDILDLLLQMYPEKVKLVTEKILQKISSNKAQHWILDFFEDLGDKELKYCQMLLQSTDKLKGGIKSLKRAPVEDGGKVDAAEVMMKMYSSDTREEVEKVLNELKDSTDDVLSDDEQPSNPSSPNAAAEKGTKNMLLDFIKKVSKETLEEVVEALVADKVLSASDRKSILEKNRTRVNKASCLVDLVYEKGAEDCQKVIQQVQRIDPALYSDLKLSQQGFRDRVAQSKSAAAQSGSGFYWADWRTYWWLYWEDSSPLKKQPAGRQPSKPATKNSSACPSWCCPFQRAELHESERIQSPGPQSEAKANVAKTASLLQGFVQKIWTEDQADFWPSVCPPGDKNAESKLWLKTTLEKLNNRELRYFHWFLQTADGFKPIRRSRLQHADRLDTVDLMLQTYPTNYPKVTQKIMEKVNNHRKHVNTSFCIYNYRLCLVCLSSSVNGESSQESKTKPVSEPGLVCKPIIQQLFSLKPYQKPVDDEKEVWQQICPEGDNDADIKQWLKEHLEDLDSREMKYFHWYLHTADKSKDGFKPIKKSRLEHANRLDTVDLMVQTYTNTTKMVAQKIFKKMHKNKGDDCKDWLLDTLLELNDKEMKYFHWYLQTAEKSKDGFKPIKKGQLEDADRLDTVDLMIQTYASNTKTVTEKILEKIKSNKDTGLPEVEEQINLTSPNEEKVLTRMLNDFVEKVPKETLSQLMEALMTANTLKSSEKETILQNHTRVNMASCFVDLVMEKGTNASKELINRLQTINPHLSSELRSPSTPGQKSFIQLFTSKKTREMTKEQEECWRQICPPGDKDADLKHWLKKTLEDLKNREVKYFHWYLRIADESKDGFQPIKRYRLKHADRLDTLDLLVQMYPGKVKEVTEKILEKIRTNKAQVAIVTAPVWHWILEMFVDMGDQDLKYCQMLLQSADKLKRSSLKKVPPAGGQEVDAMNLMMQMYNSEHREALERALNEIQESSELPEDEDQDNPASPTALRAKKMKSMLLDFIKKVPNKTLEQLLKDLVEDKVLTASERQSVVEKNHTRVNKASSLVEILKEKGPEACQKLISHVETTDPPLYAKLGSSQSPNFQQELLQMLCFNLKEDEVPEEEEEEEDK
ncbi:hypothetical protein CCH79_00017238 [Gambusia affinis]|uniref:CARD domain-containing protein n=1 Tax=Gambusia affinis TaxID=33528 RepID=A0A315WDL9_GAMAF|nr:hypothetical protein CCH79_00017238 [Gambusia affinis]